jgi:hypothetical protein
MADEATRYPFDYDALRQGDVITADRLAEVIGHEPGTSAYQLGLLREKSRIEAELEDRGKVWSVGIRGDDLRVLTHSEVAQRKPAQTRARLAGIARDHKFMVNVDVASLGSEDERARYGRDVNRMGFILAAIASVPSKIEAQPHERTKPMLPGAPG